MPSQTEITKVVKYVIDPIKRHWNADFDVDTIDDFVSDLCYFSESVLGDAMRDIRKESKGRPRLAHIVDACRRYVPKAKPPEQRESKESFHCVGHAEFKHPVQARQIMESDAGQKALSASVGRDLLNEYEVNGRMEFDDAFVEKCKKGLQNAVNAMLEARKVKFKELATFESLWTAMEAREKALYAKYYRRAA